MGQFVADRLWCCTGSNAVPRDKWSERTPLLPRHQPPKRSLAHAGARAAVRRPVVRLVEVDMLPPGIEAVALGLARGKGSGFRVRAS